jgi:hypothetical protein
VALKLGSTGSALRVGSTTAKYARVGTTLKAVAPPLDIAGSAAAAYSLRTLSYAYTGPVVEVRRSSDNATADFTADEVENGTLAAWVGAGNDGFVATWYDQSGNSRDATQATAGYQPKIVIGGSVVTANGKPAIYFANNLFATSEINLSAVSVLLVANSERNPGQSSTWVGHSTSPGLYVQIDAANGSWNFSYPSLRRVYIQGASQMNLGAMTASPTETATFVNGVPGQTGGAVTFKMDKIGSYAQYLGGPYSALGKIQELIIYPSDQSANRTAIEGNLCWHYGLENKLPYNHAEVRPQTLPTDTDVLAFAAASGAVSIPDLLKIEDLVEYLKSQSLWDYARFYPMKSAQNAGSGSTVYGLGGLTSNNMTLVNSPTWGSDGVTFASASSQYGNIGTVGGGGSMELYYRVSFTANTPPANEALGGYYYSAINDRHLQVYRATSGAFGVVRSTSGTFAAPESTLTTDEVDTQDNQTVVFVLPDGDDVAVFQNKTDLTESIVSAGEQSIAVLPDDFYFAAVNGGTPLSYANLSATAFLVIDNSLTTTTQREAITDLINAL